MKRLLPLKGRGVAFKGYGLLHTMFRVKECLMKNLLRSYSKIINLKSKLLTLKPLEGTELLHQHNGGNQAGQQIGNGHAVPHTCRIEEVGKDEQAGDEDEHLTGQWQEDGLACHADALEEVGGDHLETNDGEEHHDNA